MLWLTCGILYMFRKIGIKALTGVSKRQKFFFYRRIRPLDTCSFALIEARIHGAILVFVFIGISFWSWQINWTIGSSTNRFPFDRCPGIGCWYQCLVIGHRIPIVKVLTKFGINRLLLWTSGIFMPYTRFQAQFVRS